MNSVDIAVAVKKKRIAIMKEYKKNPQKHDLGVGSFFTIAKSRYYPTDVDGWINHYGMYCSAPMRHYTDVKAHIEFLLPKFDKVISKSPNDVEDYKEYITWILNKSIVRDAFSTHSFKVAMKRGVVINPKKSWSKVMAGIWSLRQATEKPQMMRNWCEMVRQGVDPHIAYALMSFFDITKNGSPWFIFTDHTNTHTVFQGGAGLKKIVIASVKGWLKKDERILNKTGNVISFKVSNHMIGHSCEWEHIRFISEDIKKDLKVNPIKIKAGFGAVQDQYDILEIAKQVEAVYVK